MLLYYITDRRRFPGDDAAQRQQLLTTISQAASAGVDLIQLRERDLSSRDLERLAREAVGAVRAAESNTRLLINSRIDVALAVGSDGVHLRADDIRASEARAIASSRARFMVGVSCHTEGEVRDAWSHGADFAVFAPVFEKEGRPGTGLKALRAACSAVPDFVLALGGVTAKNAQTCMDAGAVGIAGIRLFQGAGVSTLVERLRPAAE